MVAISTRRRSRYLQVFALLLLAALCLIVVRRHSTHAKTVAVIVEGRNLPNIIPLILHFAGFLGPCWPIHIFHSETNANLFASSGAVAGHVRTGGIVLHPLPNKTLNFTTHVEVSRFLASNVIWKSLLPATHALMFQTDSMLCSASARRPEDFLQYAFVGAPIAPEHGAGFNGGISLRHIPSILRVIDTFEWTTTDPEDQWYSNNIPRLDHPRAPPMPTMQQALEFGVESVWAERPMAFHQPKRWNENRMVDIMNYCPELALAEDGILWKIDP
ncbi:hypothetical protein HDU86_003297 [Geranomyces michiganensis]|nr:hypothetical protein HDU86_003297 [Geranomyces michiganensis]